MLKRKLTALSFATSSDVSRNAGGFDVCSDATLPNLPVELIWQIAAHLVKPTLTHDFERLTVRKRKYDLCALRLVCRRLFETVHDVFLSAAFSALEVDLTLSHLEALVDIARDSRYSAAVKTLHFVMAEAWPDADDWDEAYDQEVLERNYIERGAGAILLRKALDGFSNLQAIKIQPTMWFPGNSRFVTSRWPHGEGSTTSLMSTIFAALSLSTARIKTLAFTRRHPFTDDLNGPTGCYIPHFSIPSSSMAAFQHLTTLDLVIALRPSKRFDLSMAVAFTVFLSTMKQLESLSIRFDSHVLSEIVTREFLIDCKFLKLRRFRLEVAWVWKTISGCCPLLEFVRNNKHVRHLEIAFMDLDEGGCTSFLETLRTECRDLEDVSLRYITEEMSAVLFNERKCISTRGVDGMAAWLSEAQRSISIANTDHDECPAARYENYPDDSEYDSSGSG